MIGVVRVFGDTDRAKIQLRLARLRLQLESNEIGNRNGGEYPDDRHDDHEFDAGEGSIVWAQQDGLPTSQIEAHSRCRRV